MYLVNIVTKHWDGYGVESVFVTKNKKVAEKWVERFNKIILERGYWIAKYDKNLVAKASLLEPFWYDYMYKSPEAEIKDVSVR